jgi:hypothetical protein
MKNFFKTNFIAIFMMIICVVLVIIQLIKEIK